MIRRGWLAQCIAPDGQSVPVSRRKSLPVGFTPTLRLMPLAPAGQYTVGLYLNHVTNGFIPLLQSFQIPICPAYHLNAQGLGLTIL